VIFLLYKASDKRVGGPSFLDERGPGSLLLNSDPFRIMDVTVCLSLSLFLFISVTVCLCSIDEASVIVCWTLLRQNESVSDLNPSEHTTFHKILMELITFNIVNRSSTRLSGWRQQTKFLSK
jgi:hypothetical protein